MPCYAWRKDNGSQRGEERARVYQFSDDHVGVVLEGDGRLLQDGGEALAVAAPRRVKLEQDCSRPGGESG